MERGKKMIVIPEDTYDRLRTPKTEASTEGSMQTVGDNLSRLDASLYKIMNSNRYTDDYEKCKNYLQTLRRYLFFTRKERMGDDDDDDYDEAETFDNETAAKLAKPMPVSEIISSLPKEHRRDANLLLNHLLSTNRVKWDNASVVKIDNIVINNSSIADLLRSVLKKSANAFLEPSSPAGETKISTPTLRRHQYRRRLGVRFDAAHND
uniref:Uncharacterized protein n=1 Tax=Trichogramma kaykai TaxID=54128 RepID=A0ABD2W5Y0_9HYME